MIIDSHTHVGNKTTKDLISSMDEAGIDYSLLIADSAPLGDWMSTDEVIKICEGNNRLKAIGCIEYKNIDSDQIEKLITYLQDRKIYGVKLYPGYEDFYPLDEKLLTFYEKCQEINKPLIFHTGLLQSGLPGRLKQSHPLNIDDLANKFPNLKIVMAHFGNPWIIDGTMVARRNKNVYVDLSGYFGEGKFSKEHVDFFKQDLNYFRGFLDGFEKCLFASDWPQCSQREYVNAVNQLPLTDEEKNLVFWKNAKNIFQLDI